MKLREVAHARTGDKGNLVTVSVFPYRDEEYDFLVALLTGERVSEIFQHLVTVPVARYEVPNLKAVHFVLQRPIEESVTRSLGLDAHGKSLGSLLLEMEFER